MIPVNNLAIIVVAYNRTDTVSRLLNSLENATYNDRSVTLIISVDKSNTDVVEKFADEFVWSHGEKRVAKHAVNMGLRKHMLSLGKYFDEFDALCILEDDILVASSFYLYALACVEKYSNNPEIAGISLYNFPINYHNLKRFEPLKDKHDVFFMNCAMSWGEVWLKQQWLQFYEWYKVNDEEFVDSPHLPHSICSWGRKSWLKYHTRYCIENNKYFVFPYTALSTNPGEVGIHNKQEYSNLFQCSLLNGVQKCYRLPITVDEGIKYDGFFENKSLPSILAISENDICIDLNGVKGNREKKRYWLTLECQHYKVIRQFALRYHPMENNIILNIQGNTIKLYDTTINKSNKHNRKNYRLLYDSYFNMSVDFMRSYGVLNIVIDAIKLVWSKLFYK